MYYITMQCNALLNALQGALKLSDLKQNVGKVIANVQSGQNLQNAADQDADDSPQRRKPLTLGPVVVVHKHLLHLVLVHQPAPSSCT